MATNTMELKNKVIYPELSYLLVGILFSVHNELGQYAREKQYSDLLAQKLRESKVPFLREKFIGDSGNIPDFIIQNKIILELKTVPTVTREHYRQLQNYLQQTNLKLGILANFRRRFLKPERVLKVERLRELPDIR